MNSLARAIVTILNIYSVLIVVRAILSWFPVDHSNTLVRALVGVTDILLAPLRRIIPLIAGIDITPIVAILLLQLLAQWL